MSQEKGDLPLLNVVFEPIAKTASHADFHRTISKMIQLLKEIYDGKYNVIATPAGTAVHGDNVVQVIIGRDTNFSNVLKILDERAASKEDNHDSPSK